MPTEEIRGVTWGLDGEELAPWQAAQRLYIAGFTDAKELATMWAVIEAESGGYRRAWHHNVDRNPDGSIRRKGGFMEVNSTDMGFIQRNVRHDPVLSVEMTPQASAAVMARLWEENPDYANAQKSAFIARELYEKRGYQPWFAYSNGSYKRSLPRGCEAVANFLGKVLVGDETLVRRIQ